jgi:hypothetical protein
MKCKPENDEYDHQTLQLMRMQAIKAIQGGQSATEVTKAGGINRQAIYSSHLPLDGQLSLRWTEGAIGQTHP